MDAANQQQSIDTGYHCLRCQSPFLFGTQVFCVNPSCQTGWNTEWHMRGNMDRDETIRAQVAMLYCTQLYDAGVVGAQDWLKVNTAQNGACQHCQSRLLVVTWNEQSICTLCLGVQIYQKRIGLPA